MVTHLYTESKTSFNGFAVPGANGSVHSTTPRAFCSQDTAIREQINLLTKKAAKAQAEAQAARVAQLQAEQQTAATQSHAAAEAKTLKEAATKAHAEAQAARAAQLRAEQQVEQLTAQVLAQAKTTQSRVSFSATEEQADLERRVASWSYVVPAAVRTASV